MIKNNITLLSMLCIASIAPAHATFAPETVNAVQEWSKRHVLNQEIAELTENLEDSRQFANKTLRSMSDLCRTLQEEIAILQEENDTLEEENIMLKEQVATLLTLLAQQKALINDLITGGSQIVAWCNN